MRFFIMTNIKAFQEKPKSKKLGLVIKLTKKKTACNKTGSGEISNQVGH